MTNFDITYLGTSGSAATASRALPATFVVHGAKKMLFDCGEGTARQFEIAGGMPDLDAIFITHHHTDHIMGLPGVLNTYGLRGRETDLVIYGPQGTHKRLTALFAGSVGALPYDYRIVELVSDYPPLELDGLTVTPFKTQHTWNSVGWVLEEPLRPGRFDAEKAIALGVPPGPAFGRLQRFEAEIMVSSQGPLVRPEDVVGPPRLGRKVILTGDTGIGTFRHPGVIDYVKGADLLIHEATFTEEERERALKTDHCTAQEAAKVACAAGVRSLSLTHIGTRYSGRQQSKEAKAIFPDTIVPDDFYVEHIEYND